MIDPPLLCSGARPDSSSRGLYPAARNCAQVGSAAHGIDTLNAVAETSYASCGDLSLAYQVFGDGPVELVFVGPMVSHIELFWTMPEFKAFFEQLILSRRPVRQGRTRAVRPGPESLHAG